jgi:hypothetical protein
MKTEIRSATHRENELSRRWFLCRLTALATLVIGLITTGEASADWSPLGRPQSEFGGLTSRPAVGQNEDGRLELFARGAEGSLMQIWQTTGGGWSGWNNLGGWLTGNPAVSNNLDGRLEVFVHGGNDALYHRWQTTPNGNWSGYDPLGGILRSDPTVTRNWDGRMEVFVRNTDNGISHRWQVAPNAPFSGWENFSDTVNLVAGNITAIAHNAGGGLNLFWRSPNGSLRWKRQAGANGAWEAPRSLDKPPTSGIRPTGGVASDVAVAEFDGQRSDPRLVVFVRGTDNRIWYRAQTQPNGTGWTAWTAFDGSERFAGNIAVASNWDGRLQLIVRSTNGVPYQRYQTQPDSAGSWSAWESLGGLTNMDPAVGMNRDRRLEVFVIGTDGALYHRWQVTAGGGWS